MRRRKQELGLQANRGNLREGDFAQLVVGLVLVSIQVSGVIILLKIFTVKAQTL